MTAKKTRLLLTAILCAACSPSVEVSSETRTSTPTGAENSARSESASNEPGGPSQLTPSADNDRDPNGGSTLTDRPDSDGPSAAHGTEEHTRDGHGMVGDDPHAADNAEDRFVDVSHLIRNNPPRKRYGIAITDFDDDGDFEAVVTGYGGPNEVLNWSDGAIDNLDNTAIADTERRAIGVAACDITGDGKEEVYLLNVDRFGGLGEVSDRLYRRDGPAWRDVFETPANRETMNRFSGRSVACLDRSGDGKYGVFVANYGGPMKLFELDDDDALAEQAAEAGMALVTGGRSLIILPGQNGSDLFAGNEGGPNFYFENRGDGTFDEIATELGIDDPFETVRGVTTLDADGDGRLDLVYGNWEGPHRLFVNTADGHFEDVAASDMAEASRVRTVIAADFDNDGFEEIFWNNIGEPNRLFKQVDGRWVSVELGDALEPDGLGTGAAIVDFDGDGRLELLVAHGESGAQALSMYRWGRNENHYLRVRPYTRFGAPARGAIVRLRHANERQQIRVIDSGSGYLCQMEPVAHFGLGEETRVTAVDVLWPDGTQLVINEPDVDRVIDVQHPERENSP